MLREFDAQKGWTWPLVQSSRPGRSVCFGAADARRVSCPAPMGSTGAPASTLELRARKCGWRAHCPGCRSSAPPCSAGRCRTPRCARLRAWPRRRRSRSSWMWRWRVPHRMWSASSAHPARSAGNQTLRRVDRAIAAKHADSRDLSRHLTTWIDADGMVVLRGRLTPGQFDGALEVDDTAVHGSAETFRRLACDAAVVRMQLDADGQVLDVSRKTRTTPSACGPDTPRQPGVAMPAAPSTRA